MTEPTTEAGRALLDTVDTVRGPFSVRDAILAIEREAHEHGMLRQLERQLHDEPYRPRFPAIEREAAAHAALLTCNCSSANIALSLCFRNFGARAAGIDAERLAEAIRNTYIAPSASRLMDAENIAAEYARLAAEKQQP